MNLRYVLFPIDQSAENISFNLLIKLKKISVTSGSNNVYCTITECFRFKGKTERGEQSYPMSLVRYYSYHIYDRERFLIESLVL